MESMLAMLMLIPTMTGGPEGTKETLKSTHKNGFHPYIQHPKLKHEHQIEDLHYALFEHVELQ